MKTNMFISKSKLLMMLLFFTLLIADSIETKTTPNKTAPAKPTKTRTKKGKKKPKIIKEAKPAFLTKDEKGACVTGYFMNTTTKECDSKIFSLTQRVPHIMQGLFRAFEN